MDKQSIKIAKKFAEDIKKKLNISKLILFGSRARGEHLLNSDYDFVIVSEDFKNTPFILRAGDIYDSWNEEVDIEPLCYTSEEFEKKKKQIGIVRQAVQEGIEI